MERGAGRGRVLALAAVVAALGCGRTGEEQAPAASASALRAPGPYGVVDLGTLPGDVESRATAINNGGTVVGWSRDMTGRTRAFVWKLGEPLVELAPPPGATDAQAARLNASGAAVGTASVGGSARRAVVWDGGAVREVPLLPGFEDAEGMDISNSGEVVGVCTRPGASRGFRFGASLAALEPMAGHESSWALAINARGEAVGRSAPASGTPGSVAWLGASRRDLGVAGFAPRAITEGGLIVGAVTSTAAPQAILYAEGRVTALGGPGDIGGSQALGVNNQGQVVGWFAGSAGPRAFIWSEGTRYDLNHLLESGSGWELLAATAISDSGQIVGYGRAAGRVHGFLLNIHVATEPPAGDPGDAVEL